MKLNTLTLTRTIVEGYGSGNTEVVNAFDTVVSWFIANDGFRSHTLTVPDGVGAAYAVVKDYTINPSKYPNPADARAQEQEPNDAA